jgi:hypothetical protein
MWKGAHLQQRFPQAHKNPENKHLNERCKAQLFAVYKTASGLVCGIFMRLNPIVSCNMSRAFP